MTPKRFTVIVAGAVLLDVAIAAAMWLAWRLR
jgi:hypothetical protein